MSNDTNASTPEATPAKAIAALPQLNTIDRTAVREVKPIQQARLLVAIEDALSERFGPDALKRQPDHAVSPGWAVYHSETAGEKWSIAVYRTDSAHRAGEELRKLDLQVNVRTGIQQIPRLGDEAYQYGDQGMLLLARGNLLVKISSTGNTRMRRAVAAQIVKQIDHVAGAANANGNGK